MSPMITGSDTFTTVASMMTSDTPRAIAASAHQRLEPSALGSMVTEFVKLPSVMSVSYQRKCR